MLTESMTAPDGKKIVYYIWETAEPKGIVQLVHGMMEYAKRYDELAKYLNSLGYIVVADDHRAHGATAGDTAEATGFADKGRHLFHDTVQDLIQLSELSIARYALPLAIMGHSYGSFLTLSYLEHCDLSVGAILCGSAYRKGFDLTLARMISGCMHGKALDKPAKMFHNMTIGAYQKRFDEATWNTSNDDCTANIVGDPYLNRVMSNGFYKYLFSGLSSLYKKCNASKLNPAKPILIIGGENDPVSNSAKLLIKLAKFLDKYCLDVKSIIYPDMRHEIMREVGYEAVYADIGNFVDRVISAKEVK